MSEREEFVRQACAGTTTITALCQRYGISRKTGYKWLRRFREGGVDGLADRSRRPHRSPNQTGLSTEKLVVGVREEYPAWGARKIKAFLERKGHGGLPAASTITAILDRHGMLDPEERLKHRPYQRFEMAEPNQLWQMDFKGPIALPDGYCHALTILDDRSRYLLGLRACPNYTRVTVQAHLTDVFRCYGLPQAVLTDHGSPWGNSPEHPYTGFAVWLMCLGVTIIHGQPYHPQTRGKAERLIRTLSAEVLRQTRPVSLADCQNHFDRWRDVYNHERPHEALDMDSPAAHYHPSSRPFPDVLPSITYPSEAEVRKVDISGWISFRNHKIKIGRPFRGHPVGLIPSETAPDTFDVHFLDKKVDRIALPTNTPG